MIDRKKVIKGLEMCTRPGTIRCFRGLYECPYEERGCRFQMETDALTLLKDQEPVKPTWSQGKAYCGNCGQRLPRKREDRKINYCSYCGQEVQWNG